MPKGVIYVALLMVCVLTNCSKKERPISDPFGHSIPQYGFSEFSSFAEFNAKLINKVAYQLITNNPNKTNLFILVVLEKPDGMTFAVMGYNASEKLFQNVLLLETNKNYSFPQALMSK